MTTVDLTTLAERNRRQSAPRLLVENRTVYETHGVELSIYDTFSSATQVRLEAEEILYCGMISGRKVLHGKNHFNEAFIPHESFVMAPGETVTIDFPDASSTQPTSCLALGIDRNRLRQVCDSLNIHGVLPRELEHWKPDAAHLLHVFHTEATQQLLVRIVDSFLGKDPDRDLVLDLGVTELLTRMLRQQGHDFLVQCAKGDPTLTGMTAAVRYIDDHLASAIDIDSLCKVACMSRSKLYAHFNKLIGSGPMEYVQQQRLAKARVLIAGGRGITAVCYEVGFQSPSHFTRRFHQQFGESPRQYAAHHQMGASIANEAQNIHQ
jgi:AraC-like DNA-binding protein